MRTSAIKRSSIIAVALCLGATALAGCSNGSQALAAAACSHVKRSLTLYNDSLRGGPDAQRLYRRAVSQLDIAEPIAAQATSQDPQWNPLMTTLQAISKSPESNLVTALRAQCQVALGGSLTSGPHSTSTTTVANTPAANGV